MLEAEMFEAHFEPDTEENRQYVKDVLAWIDAQPESNNYFHNLKVACALDHVKHSNIRLISSVFPAYDKQLAIEAERRERERKAQEEANKSEWFGEVGQRVTLKIIDTNCVTSWETIYGITRIYKMLDEAGHVFTWKTGKYVPVAPNKITVKATIKEHNEFRGIKQTELTRCKSAEWDAE